MVTLETTDLRHGYAELDAVRLHYAEVGEGPLVVLLHGFPEFWFAWRFQIPALAEAGFRVVAPDIDQDDRPVSGRTIQWWSPVAHARVHLGSGYWRCSSSGGLQSAA